MRTPALALSLLALLGVRAAASEFRFEERAVIGLGGGYFGNNAEAGITSPRRVYELSARVRSFRYGDAFPGIPVEYSAALRRDLYHATLVGRLGTKPPNAERAGYHLAYGEVRFTFYGLTLGPERPELSHLVWESSGPAPAPESLERTWVTRLRGRYTNTNHHIESNAGVLVVVQNSWQFELRETWREKTSLALHGGFDRYNRVLLNDAPTIFLDNVQYAGGAFAVRGWPNNHVGAEASQALGKGWKLTAGATRLNLLNNALETMVGGEVEWRPRAHWTGRLGYHQRRRRGLERREGLSLGLSYAW